ncbi:hypothetical protein AAHC03_024240 [Spirometra sp. Aus1]
MRNEVSYSIVTSLGGVVAKGTCEIVLLNNEEYYACTDLRLPLNFEVLYVPSTNPFVMSIRTKHVAELVANIAGRINTDPAQPTCAITVLSLNSLDEERSEGISLPFDYISMNNIRGMINTTIANLMNSIPLTC